MGFDTSHLATASVEQVSEITGIPLGTLIAMRRKNPENAPPSFTVGKRSVRYKLFGSNSVESWMLEKITGIKNGEMARPSWLKPLNIHEIELIDQRMSELRERHEALKLQFVRLLEIEGHSYTTAILLGEESLKVRPKRRARIKHLQSYIQAINIQTEHLLVRRAYLLEQS